MTVVVVGRQRVELGAVLLDRPGDEISDLLRGRNTAAEDVLVADASFVLLVIKVKRAVLVDYRPDGLARGAGDTPHQDGALAFQDQLRRILRVELIVGLRIELHDAELLAKDSAGGIDVVDGEFRRVDHR